MKYIGGYSILDLTDANVSAQANVCYNQDKPVLVYGANGEKFFADTITKDGTNIIITKGGKTITINDVNAVSSDGDIQTISYRKKVFLYFTHSEESDVTLLLFINENDKNEITTPAEATQELYDKYVKSNVGVIGLDDNGEQIVALYECSDINDNTFIIGGTTTDQYVFDRIEIHLV